MKAMPGRALLSAALCLFALSLARLEAGSTVQFRTPLGDIDVELYEDKPVTTRNFLNYVESGAYSGTVLHRWKPNFVIQGGGFYVYYFSGFGYYPFAVTSQGAITNEYNVGRVLSNTKGTIAMAKTAEGPNSATCQWFFNLGDNSANLDNQNGGFTVFGRVVGGLEVLERFNQTNAANNLYLCSDCTNLYAGFTEMPLYNDGSGSQLLYIDVTALKVKVQPDTNAPGSKVISWNSRSNRVNVVEYSRLTNAPPTWTSLCRTNGTGSAMIFTDTPPASDRRFYRVRIEY